MAAVMPEAVTPKLAPTDLPAEFTVHLGAQAHEQATEVARKLRLLGADVHVDREGSLIAIRPL